MSQRVLYLDCFSGISGDMLLGACLDAGLPLAELKEALGSLALSGCEVTAERVLRGGISATKFSVHDHSDGASDVHSPVYEGPNRHSHRHDPADPAHAAHHEHPGQLGHRTLPEIFALIDTSALSPAGRQRARALFERLAKAEAEIHHTAIERVHLHEVGAVDSIIDIVGAVFAMEWVGADRIVCSPLNVGGGTVETAHGTLPVPVPATVKLLGAAPVYGGTVQKELVTPTGALIATAYASTFGRVPPMSVERVGYGAGARDNPGTPNVLRILIGRAADRPSAERVVVIECEIDDMNPQLFGSAMDRLYAAGALEVFYAPVQMKKNRPGTLLTIVAAPELRSMLSEIVFRETTTIGLRYSEMERDVLQREIVPVDTALGVIRFKVAWRDGRVVNAVPEFEDCAALAKARNLSVKDVQTIALQAYGAPHRAPATQT